MDGIIEQVPLIQEALNQIEDKSNEMRAKPTANAFLKQISSFDCFFALCFAHRLFERTNILSKELQNPKTSTGEGIFLTKHLKNEFMNWCKNDEFENISLYSASAYIYLTLGVLKTKGIFFGAIAAQT